MLPGAHRGVLRRGAAAAAAGPRAQAFLGFQRRAAQAVGGHVPLPAIHAQDRRPGPEARAVENPAPWGRGHRKTALTGVRSPRAGRCAPRWAPGRAGPAHDGARGESRGERSLG